MKLGVIGLGKMEGNIALQAVARSIKTVGKSRGPKPELSNKGVIVVENYKQFVEFLDPPRTIFLSLPTGPVIDSVINNLVPLLNRATLFWTEAFEYMHIKTNNIFSTGFADWMLTLPASEL